MPREQVDAVVIGSGPNGLAAAVRLARAGRSVVVCEAQPVLGGAVRSEELTLPGFVHDRYSAVHPAGAASPVFGRLPLAEHGLEWVRPDVAMAHPLPDGRAAALHQDLGRTADCLDELGHGDGAAWARWAAPYLERFDALRRTLLGGFPPVGAGLRLAAGLGPARTLELARLVLLSASALADELGASDGTRAWLYGTVLHSDVPVREAGSALAGAYLHLLGHGVGWPSPRGGAGALTGALVSYLRSLGGDVRPATPVVRVVATPRRVAGVVTATGDEIAAGTVVADVGPRGLLALAGHRLPAGYASRLARFRYAPGTVKVDWALSAPVPWQAPEARRAGTIHVGGWSADVARHGDDLRAGRLPERPFVLVGQQSLADPTRAPAGRHTAWGYTRVPQGPMDRATVLAHAERLTDQVERFAPGFRDVVLARHVAGPADLEAGNANLVGGDVGGGANDLDQLVFRPVPSLVPYRTPISGLWLGSASTFPGSAVHGVPGWAAAGYALAAERARLGR